MDMYTGKEKIYAIIEGLKNQIIEINDYIHDNPELGNQEVKAHALLTDTFAAQGFLVNREVSGLSTAFRAVYRNGSGGPTIGLLCEYDALKDLGHGCGHNMQAAAITGAALAFVKGIGDIPATLIVYGTPAEETTSGKVVMAKNGVFDELDVALMMHGSDRTTVDGTSLAVNCFDFIFEGKSAHAAIAPDRGISALDAVLLTFNGIEYLREHVRPDVRIHGVITDGGRAPNIVPERAAAQYYIRASNRSYLDTVVERVLNVARGAALMTGAKLTIKEVKAYDNKINVEALNKLLLTHAQEAGAKNITSPRKFTGSTDFSCVTYRVPGAALRVAFVPQDTSSHSMEWVVASKSEEAHAAVLVAAKALAGSCYELATNADLMQQIKLNFEASKNAQSE